MNHSMINGSYSARHPLFGPRGFTTRDINRQANASIHQRGTEGTPNFQRIHLGVAPKLRRKQRVVLPLRRPLGSGCETPPPAQPGSFDYRFHSQLTILLTIHDKMQKLEEIPKKKSVGQKNNMKKAWVAITEEVFFSRLSWTCNGSCTHSKPAGS